MLNMGGRSALTQHRYMRFDFVVKRESKEIARHAHLWDQQTGRYRITGLTSDGLQYDIMYSDINEKMGAVWIQDTLIEDARRMAYLEYGYGRFINDTYWLLMPWKLLDQGVHLKAEGQVVDSNSAVTWDVLHVSFDSVGLTPGDQYWAYINPKTGFMERWKYKLQGSGKSGDFLWSDWKSYDGVWLCDRKRSVDGSMEIINDGLRLLLSVDDGVFRDHSLPLP